MIVSRSSEMTATARSNFKRTLRVCYPPGEGKLVIRTELDWELNIHPIAVSSDGSTATFESRGAKAIPPFQAVFD